MVLWIKNLSLHFADKAGSSFMGWSITMNCHQSQAIRRVAGANLIHRYFLQVRFFQNWGVRNTASKEGSVNR